MDTNAAASAKPPWKCQFPSSVLFVLAWMEAVMVHAAGYATNLKRGPLHALCVKLVVSLGREQINPNLTQQLQLLKWHVNKHMPYKSNSLSRTDNKLLVGRCNRHDKGTCEPPRS